MGLRWYSVAMELPATEILTRSRNETALRVNSQKTRYQRTWPGRACSDMAAPRGGVWIAAHHAEWAFNKSKSLSATMFSWPGCSIKEFIDSAPLLSPVENTIEGVPFRNAALTSVGVIVMRCGSQLI